MAAIAAIGGCLLAASARAQDDPVERLDEALRRSPNVVDTALVFTNLGNAPTRVSLVAFTNSGRPAGRKEIEVPGNGVQYVLASELVDTTDPQRFVGKVMSRGLGRLASTAVLIGGALTDLPTIDQNGRVVVSPDVTQAYTSTTFPLVVTY